MYYEGHFQHAYVTRDIEKAMALMQERYGVPAFNSFVATPNVDTPHGRGPAEMKVALGWVGNTQIELIEPVSGHVDLYRGALGDDWMPRFHHVGMRVDNWDRFRDQITRDGRKVVIEGKSANVCFLYIDERESIGHYLEYIWFSPEHWEQMKPPQAKE